LIIKDSGSEKNNRTKQEIDWVQIAHLEYMKKYGPNMQQMISNGTVHVIRGLNLRGERTFLNSRKQNWCGIIFYRQLLNCASSPKTRTGKKYSIF
jgi:hypothetical protein